MLGQIGEGGQGSEVRLQVSLPESRREGTSRGNALQEAGRERDRRASWCVGGAAGRLAMPGEGPGHRLRWADRGQTTSEPRTVGSSASLHSRAAREDGVVWLVSVGDPLSGCLGQMLWAGERVAGGDRRTLGMGPGKG